MSDEPGKHYTSPSGREWRWCRNWQCWQFDDYTYKIHYSTQDDFFICSSFEVWHEGAFKTFEDAEKEVMGDE